MKEEITLKITEEELKLLIPYIKYKKIKKLNWLYFIPYTSTSYEMILDYTNFIKTLEKIVDDRSIKLLEEEEFNFEIYFDKVYMTFIVKFKLKENKYKPIATIMGS